MRKVLEDHQVGCTCWSSKEYKTDPGGTPLLHRQQCHWLTEQPSLLLHLPLHGFHDGLPWFHSSCREVPCSPAFSLGLLDHQHLILRGKQDNLHYLASLGGFRRAAPTWMVTQSSLLSRQILSGCWIPRSQALVWFESCGCLLFAVTQLWTQRDLCCRKGLRSLGVALQRPHSEECHHSYTDSSMPLPLSCSCSHETYKPPVSDPQSRV